MPIAAAAAEMIALIRESAAGVADRRDLGRVRKLRFQTPGIDRETWRTIADLGWIGLRIPEEKGGVGLGMSAYCALAEELGAALVPEPLIGAGLAAAFLDGERLEAQLSGRLLALPVWQESRDACAPEGEFTVTAGRISGVGRYVPAALAADAFVAIGANGAWLIDARDPCVSVELSETQDGGHYGAVAFVGAEAAPLSGDATAAFAEATLATSAYLLGLTQEAFVRTLDYLKTRAQFGKLIGSFQALQHRAVDLALQVELTRASVEEAAARWDQAPGSAPALAAVSRAKARAASAAMLITRQAIQLHGGIGYTDEHDIGLYLRKAMAVAPQFGTADLHRARFRALSPPAQIVEQGS